MLSYSFMEWSSEFQSELAWSTPGALRSKNMGKALADGQLACGITRYAIASGHRRYRQPGSPFSGQLLVLLASVSNFLSHANGFRVALD